jgi:hypothetical protein
MKKRSHIATLGLWLAFDIIVGYLYAITPENMVGLRSALAIAQLVALVLTAGVAMLWLVDSF